MEETREVAILILTETPCAPFSLALPKRLDLFPRSPAEEDKDGG